MGLNDKQKAQLRRLQELADAPDEAPVSRTASYHVDLSDSKAVELARRLGLLGGDDDDDDDDDDEEEETRAPKRRGGGSRFFGDN